MSKLRLKVDPDRITIDDLVAIEEGGKKSRYTRDLLAKFLIDDQGKFLPEEESRKIIGALTLTEVMQVGQQLAAEIRKLMSDLVPPNTAGE